MKDKIEEILNMDTGVPEMWAGNPEYMPKDKRIQELTALIEQEKKEAVRGFVYHLKESDLTVYPFAEIEWEVHEYLQSLDKGDTDEKRK